MDFSKVFKDYRTQPRNFLGQWVEALSQSFSQAQQKTEVAPLVRSGTGIGMLLLKAFNPDQARDESGKWTSGEVASGGKGKDSAKTPKSRWEARGGSPSEGGKVETTAAGDHLAFHGTTNFTSGKDEHGPYIEATIEGGNNFSHWSSSSVESMGADEISSPVGYHTGYQYADGSVAYAKLVQEEEGSNEEIDKVRVYAKRKTESLQLVRSGSGIGMLLLKGNIDQPRDDSGRWTSGAGSNEGRQESVDGGNGGNRGQPRAYLNESHRETVDAFGKGQEVEPSEVKALAREVVREQQSRNMPSRLIQEAEDYLNELGPGAGDMDDDERKELDNDFMTEAEKVFSKRRNPTVS